MMRRRIRRLLVERPMTMDELAEELGVPRALVRAAMLPDFYHQQEIDHPEHGEMTVWSVRAGAVRVDSKGRYHYAPPRVA